jgi:hypothetical protein
MILLYDGQTGQMVKIINAYRIPMNKSQKLRRVQKQTTVLVILDAKFSKIIEQGLESIFKSNFLDREVRIYSIRSFYHIFI